MAIQVKATPRPCNGQLSRFSRIKLKLEAVWHRSQIGHRSEYSVERLLAFRDYYQRTSLLRAIAVCISAPIPAVLVALAIDAIPLRPPSDGWRENYAVWIRLLLGLFVEALGVAFQVKAVILPGVMTNFGAVKIAFATSISSVLATMAVAATWEFPIPYGYVIMLNVYISFFIIYMMLVIGPRKLRTSPVLKQQMKSELLIMANQGGVAVCYPIFSAVFNSLSGIEQAVFICVMPLIKFIAKQNIAYAAGSFYEFVGPMLVFTVDLFNVYYVAICMQSSKSLAATMVIMASDSFHVLLALRTILSSSKTPRHYLQDLPAIIQQVFLDVAPSSGRERHIRLLAPFPLPLSDESRAFMNELTKTGSFLNDTVICATRSAIKRSSQIGPAIPLDSQPSTPTTIAVKQNRIAPVSPVQSLKTKPSQVPTAQVWHPEASEQVVKEALQTLFHSEYVLLAEYIEFMVPVLYSLYLLVLFHLPVAAYYPHTAAMTTEKLKTTVGSILIYAAIEFVAFAALLLLLRRKFGLSPLYQLAFVLETQAPFIQGHLFLWTITILHLTLVHFGADFIVQAG